MAVKSLKSKIAVGVLATGLVTGMGSAFAATNAGDQFKAWYGVLFSKTAAQVTTDIANEYNPKIDGFYKEFEGLKSNSTKAIVDGTATKSNSSMVVINQAKNDYITQLTNAQGGLTVVNDFSKFTVGVTKSVDVAASGALSYGRADLKKAIDAQGKTSVALIETQVEGYKASSTKDLADKIKEAKDQISALVAEQKLASTAAIRSHIDTKIAELTAALNLYAAQLVQLQMDAVVAKGDAEQAEALAALDALAAGIK